MSVVKTADAPSVDAGGQAGFTVTISNAPGTSTATGLSLTDPLPTEAGTALNWSIDPASPNASTFVISGGSLQLLNNGAVSLASGSSLVVHVVATTVPTASPLTVPLVNTATITVPNVPPVPPATATENVLSPDVTVTKTADAPSVVAGATAGFTVTVTNTGPGTANGVTFSDPLPTLGNGNVWSIASQTTPGAFSISGGQLVLSPTTLATGATLSVHITGTTTAADLTLVNTVTVSATNEAPPSRTSTRLRPSSSPCSHRRCRSPRRRTPRASTPADRPGTPSPSPTPPGPARQPGCR
ncbi:DUF11 domain-containing protein [Fimbriiglobus ruber]|uniref:DUF11 domain-containing protein n=1 Tax=Fimbriiglobus ruber TaxID=1908690 RepID=UPI000B4A8955|nr:DUF11 domain-containing protein [Fimbriiglobus ruber]